MTRAVLNLFPHFEVLFPVNFQNMFFCCCCFIKTLKNEIQDTSKTALVKFETQIKKN